MNESLTYGYELSSKDLAYLGRNSVEEVSAVDEWQGFGYDNEVEAVLAGGELATLGWYGVTPESYWSGQSVRYVSA